MIEPAHGDRRRYQRGCRCSACRRAHGRYMARYHFDRARGHRRRVDAAAVAAHLRALGAQGWSPQQIAVAVGSSPSFIVRVKNGSFTTVRTETAARILAARPSVGVVQAGSLVDATGTIRRVRALVAIGYEMKAIAAAAGASRTRLGDTVLHGREQVTARLARAVAALYTDWSKRPGPSVRSRRMAAARGWHGPMAWDDLDDPQAQPESDGRQDAVGSRREAVDPTEVARLTRAGLTTAQIARELRCHERTVTRARRRATEMEVAA